MNNDNIENIFKSQLLPVPVAEAWNEPDMDVWENASGQFKSRKKRRLVIFYWIVGLCSLFLIAGLLRTYLSSSPLSSSIKKDQFSKTSTYGKRKLITKIQETKIEDSSVGTTEKPKSFIKDKSPLIISESKTISSSNIIRKLKNKTSNSFKKPNLDLKKTGNVGNSLSGVERLEERVDISVQQNIFDKTVINIVEQYKPISKMKSLGVRNSILNAELEAHKSIRNSKEQKIESGKSEQNKESTPHSLTKNGFTHHPPVASTLILPSTINLSILTRRKIKLSSHSIQVIQTKNRPRWDVGLATSPFIVNPTAIIDNELYRDFDNYALHINHYNVGIPVRKYGSDHWSFKSGIYYSKLSLGLDFSKTQYYDGQTSLDDTEVSIVETILGGTLSINDNSEAFMLEFVDNTMLLNGAKLDIIGRLPLHISAIQLPLAVNYHKGNNKWRIFGQAGIAIEYYDVKIPYLDLQVYFEDRLITKPVSFFQNENLLGGTAYLGLGGQYHFHDRFFAEVSLRADALDLDLSKYELSVHYVIK